SLRRMLREVKTRQRLRRHDAALFHFDCPKPLEEPRRKLPIAVTHKPHVGRVVRRPEREIAGRARRRDTVLLHQVTMIETISCGSATNRTMLPRCSSTSATASFSSARTRCAVFTPWSKRHAPETLRPVAL